MEAWDRIERWLEQNAPEVHQSLAPGASTEAIAALETAVGVSLTEDERASFARHDGQDSFGPPLVEDWQLLQSAEIPNQRTMMIDIAKANPAADDAVQADNGIAARWFADAWVPFAHDGAGNLLCLDHAPEAGGTNGQLISVSSADPVRKRVAAGVGEWLAKLAADFEGGTYAFRDGRMLKT